MERVITASVLHSLLNELLPNYNDWKAKSIAGNNTGLLRQSRKQQNEIVEEFREGKVIIFSFFFFSSFADRQLNEDVDLDCFLQVNVIVATSILEEGLDVQSCNLVVRFDPASTVSSFIQSRGRARMPNSDFLLLVER